MQKGFSVVNLHGTASGVIAIPVIGDNGHWWVGNDDTGVKAQGPKGEDADPDVITKLCNDLKEINSLLSIKTLEIDSAFVLRQQGNVISAIFSGYAIGASGNLSVIPELYRPSLIHTFQTVSFSKDGVSDSMANITIKPNGDIFASSLNTTLSNAIIWGSTAWIV